MTSKSANCIHTPHCTSMNYYNFLSLPSTFSSKVSTIYVVSFLFLEFRHKLKSLQKEQMRAGFLVEKAE